MGPTKNPTIKEDKNPNLCFFINLYTIKPNEATTKIKFRDKYVCKAGLVDIIVRESKIIKSDVNNPRIAP